ncbi:LOW QUALITY PROTEIN: neuropeptides capa receptor-like [Centruroides vittatus]|uniref:LOW QUALITY PROTEIN: neuropeptides capa receptor-like n=1 Tax=Centruroides vittatus TaxID=120091 RepID=UPI00350E9739
MDSRSNSTLKEYLEIRLGPQHLPSSVVVPITIVYVLIFISGVIGNAVVCLVIARNSQFQTPTNYYLFSLAISDLLILIFGLPNDLKVFWQQYPWTFGDVICRLRAYVAEMTSNASVLTIVAFTTERYIAICHPLLVHKFSTLTRAIKIISTVWVLACASAIPFAVYTRINYLDYPADSGILAEESGICTLPMDNNDVTFPLLHFSTIVFFCLPMTVIIILYIKIGLKLRFSKFSGMLADESKYSPSSGSSNRQNHLRKSVHKMLVGSIAFFVCWAPFHAQRLLTANVVSHEDWTAQLRRLNEVLYYSAGCFYYFSATINPILYSLLSAKYRGAFRETLCSFTARNEAKSSQFGRYPTRHSNSYACNNEKHYSIREVSNEERGKDENKHVSRPDKEKLNGFIPDTLHDFRETPV